VAGVLYAYWNRFVSPAAATFHASAEAVLMGILGGTGTILGPFIGAAIILGIRNWVSGYVGWWTAVMGLVFIATVLWAPHGLLGLVREMGGRSAARRTPAPRAAALGQTSAAGTSAMTGAGRPGSSQGSPPR
jgi:branched-chain amino acid transport system permease protein